MSIVFIYIISKLKSLLCGTRPAKVLQGNYILDLGKNSQNMNISRK